MTGLTKVGFLLLRTNRLAMTFGLFNSKSYSVFAGIRGISSLCKVTCQVPDFTHKRVLNSFTWTGSCLFWIHVVKEQDFTNRLDLSLYKGAEGGKTNSACEYTRQQVKPRPKGVKGQHLVSGKKMESHHWKPEWIMYSYVSFGEMYSSILPIVKCIGLI